ncbi:hypothetical protein VYU27_007420 [Nannochloropsis oceanica]
MSSTNDGSGDFMAPSYTESASAALLRDPETGGGQIRSEATGAGEENQPGGGGLCGCLSVRYYQPYFDVDTAHVKDRILYAIFPFNKESTFIQLLGPNPDAYGPFWVATSLIFVIAVVSNLSSYFHFDGEEGSKWTYDFAAVVTCATTIYGFAVYDAAFLKQYISAARQCDPYVPPELSSFIVNEYVTLRSEKDETGSGGHGRSKSNRGRGLAAAGAASSISDQTVMTARQLLSILRLSQALARLRFDDAVNVADVEEAIRLTRMSKASLLDDNEDQERDTRDDMSKIYTLILDYMQSHRLPRMEYIRAEAMVVQKGWRTEQLREMLDFYVEADVFRVSADRTMIELFNTD